jgi:hypothetical protein
MPLKLMLMLRPHCGSASAETQTLKSLKSAAEAAAGTQPPPPPKVNCCCMWLRLSHAH